jgi:hypothetical protein
LGGTEVAYKALYSSSDDEQKKKVSFGKSN